MRESRFVTVKGLQLHYLDFGSEGRPTLVCIHGLNGNAHAFDQFADAMAATHHVISLDLRGHGDSQSGPRSDYEVPNYLADVNELLEALKITRMSIVGSSLGGAIAMIIAASHPDRVEKLVLNDIGAEINPAGLRSAAERPSLTGREFDAISDAVDLYRKSYPPAALLAEPVITELIKNSVQRT